MIPKDHELMAEVLKWARSEGWRRDTPDQMDSKIRWTRHDRRWNRHERRWNRHERRSICSAVSVELVDPLRPILLIEGIGELKVASVCQAIGILCMLGIVPIRFGLPCLLVGYDDLRLYTTPERHHDVVFV